MVAEKRLGSGAVVKVEYYNTDFHPRDLTDWWVSEIVAWGDLGDGVKDDITYTPEGEYPTNPAVFLYDLWRSVTPESTNKTWPVPEASWDLEQAIAYVSTLGHHVGEREYPGVLVNLYSTQAVDWKLRTGPFRFQWELGQIGWAYVPPAKIQDRQLPHRTALALLTEEVSRICQYLNDDVYYLYVEGGGFGDSLEHGLYATNIYPEEGQTVPSDEVLDEALAEFKHDLPLAMQKIADQVGWLR